MSLIREFRDLYRDPEEERYEDMGKATKAKNKLDKVFSLIKKIKSEVGREIAEEDLSRFFDNLDNYGSILKEMATANMTQSGDEYRQNVASLDRVRRSEHNKLMRYLTTVYNRLAEAGVKDAEKELKPLVEDRKLVTDWVLGLYHYKIYQRLLKK